jgi:hypothetical protein
MIETTKMEAAHVTSRSNPLALSARSPQGHPCRLLTPYLQEGAGHVASRRNSLAVIAPSIPIHTNQTFPYPESQMQTDIEILESRENPMIVWY